eukprot:8735537-Pyramimonas_sp.AAC.2
MIARANRGKGTGARGNLERRGFKRAVISGRKTYRGIFCPCERFADRRPMCPMRRSSRSPNF